MVDVIDIPFAAAQLEHVLQRVHQVLAPQRHHRFRHRLIELAVDAEAPHAPEPITVFIEELLFEQRLRLLDLRRIPRSKTRVNLQQRILVALRRVFRQRVEHQRVRNLRDHFNVLQVRRLNLVDRLGDLRARLHQLFTALGVNDRRRRVIARLKLRDLDRLHVIELADDRFGCRVFLVQRPHKGRRRNLRRLVDANRQRILLRHRALDP